MAKEKKNKKGKNSSDYNAESITVLEGLEPVRRRPGMYIGTTRTGRSPSSYNRNF